MILMAVYMLAACGGVSTSERAKTEIMNDSDGKAEVPDCVNLSYRDAVNVLTDKGFQNVTSNIDTSIDEDRWIVVDQSIKKNTRILPSDPIDLICKYMCILQIDIDSDTNLLFSKYDISISLDGEEIGTVSNGEKFSKEVEVLNGDHQLSFCKKDSTSPKGEALVTVENDSKYSCKLTHDRKEIAVEKADTQLISIRPVKEDQSNEMIALSEDDTNQTENPEEVAARELIESENAEESARAASEAEKASIEAAEKASKEAEEKASREAEEKASREAAEKESREAAEKASREAAEQASKEAAEKASREAAEKASKEAAEKASKEAAEKASREAAEHASREAAEKASREAAEQTQPAPKAVTFIANANTKKFHKPSCSSVDQMADHNKVYFYGDRQEVINAGYEPCKRCHP